MIQERLKALRAEMEKRGKPENLLWRMRNLSVMH